MKAGRAETPTVTQEGRGALHPIHRNAGTIAMFRDAGQRSVIHAESRCEAGHPWQPLLLQVLLHL